MYTCFIDFRKAFDVVNRKVLLYKLREYYGIDGLYFNIVENMYKDVLKSIFRFWYHIIEAPDTSIVKMTYMDGLDSKTTLVKRIEKTF